MFASLQKRTRLFKGLNYISIVFFGGIRPSIALPCPASTGCINVLMYAAHTEMELSYIRGLELMRPECGDW